MKPNADHNDCDFAQREIALLRLCARVDPAERANNEIESLLAKDVDWPLFTRLARRHRVLPLAHHTLSRFAASVPPEVHQALAIAFLVNAEKNRALSNELMLIAGRFAERGLDLMPIKGPSIAKWVYGNIALRQNGDLDILIRSKDTQAATKIMLDMGYDPPEQLAADDSRKYLTDGHFMESAASLRQLEFARPSDQLLVELHWEVGPRFFPFALDNQRIWSHAIPEVFDGERVQTLPTALMFLLLVDHGAKHGWSRLSWLCDIAEMIKHRPDLEWDSVVEYARVLRMRTMVRVAVQLAAKWLDCPIPAEAEALLTPTRTVSELIKAVDRVCRSDVEQVGLAWHEHYFRLRCSDRIMQRLKYGSFILTTPTEQEWALIKLPRPLSALYAAIRPLRLAAVWATRRKSGELKVES